MKGKIDRIERTYGIRNLVVEPEEDVCSVLDSIIYNVYPRSCIEGKKSRDELFETLHKGEEAILCELRRRTGNPTTLKIPGEGLSYMVNYGDGEYNVSLKWFERGEEGFDLKGIRLKRIEDSLQLKLWEDEEWVYRNYNTRIEEIIDRYEREKAERYFEVIDEDFLYREREYREKIRESNWVDKRDLNSIEKGELIRKVRKMEKIREREKRKWLNERLERVFPIYVED